MFLPKEALETLMKKSPIARLAMILLAAVALASLPGSADEDGKGKGKSKGKGNDGNTGRQMRASLDGYQVVPAISTTAEGALRGTLQNDGFTYRLSYTNLEGAVLAGHVRFGQSDVNGGVLAFVCGGGGKPACPQSGEISGEITAGNLFALSDQGIEAANIAEVVRAIRSGNVYVTILTTRFPQGEIRGQIRVGDDDEE